MFFKKKPTVQPLDMGALIVDLARELYRGLGNPGGMSAVSATLVLDESQQIATIDQPVVDGAPKMPSPEAVESMNVLLRPLANAPENLKLKSLGISFKDGQFDTDIKYLTD